MVKIVVLDLDISNLVNLDNQQAEEVIGDAIGFAGGAVGGATGSILDNVFHREPIDWRSAAAWEIGGGVGAGLAGGVIAAFGGPETIPVGAALAKQD